MPDAETHRLARAQAKARRNAGRRLGRRAAVAWQRAQDRRCVACGRWIALGAEAGYGYGFAFCEACHLAAELRRAAVRARLLPLPAMHAVVVTGAA